MVNRIALCLSLLLIGVAARAEEGVWQSMGTQEGIALAFKDVPGSKVIAFRGDGVIDAPIATVAAVLLDQKRAPEWVDRLSGRKVIRIVNPTEYVELNHFKMPPLLNDREFVADAKMSLDPSARSFTVVFHSIEDAAVPENKFVRGSVDSVFVMTSLDNGRRTRMQAEMHADPKGALPKFLVNFFQRSWPFDAFQSIRRQVAKKDIQRPVEFAAVLAQVEELAR